MEENVCRHEWTQPRRKVRYSRDERVHSQLELGESHGSILLCQEPRWRVENSNQSAGWLKVSRCALSSVPSPASLWGSGRCRSFHTLPSNIYIQSKLSGSKGFNDSKSWRSSVCWASSDSRENIPFCQEALRAIQEPQLVRVWRWQPIFHVSNG